MTVDLIRLVVTVVDHVTPPLDVNTEPVMTPELTDVAGAQSEDRHFAPLTDPAHRPEREGVLQGPRLHPRHQQTSPGVPDLPEIARLIPEDEGPLESSPVDRPSRPFMLETVVLIHQTPVRSPLQSELGGGIH